MIIKREYFYKLVVKKDYPLIVNRDRYRSIFPTAPVHYGVGITTQPRRDIPHSKLFVFGSLEAAKLFVKDSIAFKQLKIFLCRTTNAMLAPSRISSDVNIDHFINFWKKGYELFGDLENVELARWLPTPLDTWLVDSVTLLQEITI